MKHLHQNWESEHDCGRQPQIETQGRHATAEPGHACFGAQSRYAGLTHSNCERHAVSETQHFGALAEPGYADADTHTLSAGLIH